MFPRLITAGCCGIGLQSVTLPEPVWGIKLRSPTLPPLIADGPASNLKRALNWLKQVNFYYVGRDSAETRNLSSHSLPMQGLESALSAVARDMAVLAASVGIRGERHQETFPDRNLVHRHHNHVCGKVRAIERMGRAIGSHPFAGSTIISEAQTLQNAAKILGLQLVEVGKLEGRTLQKFAPTLEKAVELLDFLVESIDQNHGEILARDVHLGQKIQAEKDLHLDHDDMDGGVIEAVETWNRRYAGTIMYGHGATAPSYGEIIYGNGATAHGAAGVQDHPRQLEVGAASPRCASPGNDSLDLTKTVLFSDFGAVFGSDPGLDNPLPPVYAPPQHCAMPLVDTLLGSPSLSPISVRSDYNAGIPDLPSFLLRGPAAPSHTPISDYNGGNKGGFDGRNPDGSPFGF